jgi:acetylornithine deacetylase
MIPPIDPAELTLRLMSIESTSGQEGDVIAWLTPTSSSAGGEPGASVTPGRDDLFATAVDHPLVTLSTHLDTVPPFIPRAWSTARSTAAAHATRKGIAAAMICAAERLRTKAPRLALLFVGREVTHDGAHAANEAIAAKQIRRRVA